LARLTPYAPGFNLFDGWNRLRGSGSVEQARAAVARGQAIFNTTTFMITGVPGIPDGPGTCSTCHDVGNVGNHSTFAFFNIGVADGARRTPDLPLYTLRNRATGATVDTTDPGRALITGKWEDVGAFKVPILRGLAARAPH